MECRICHQPISFIRGRFPDRRKTATLAVHESELPSLLQQTNSTVVTPHPGAQRKLRQELEEQHRRTAATPEPAAAALAAETAVAAEEPPAAEWPAAHAQTSR
jgi:hypothetical protein